MKIGAIIQARMGSSRLAGKVMKDLYGKSVLNHVIDRVKNSKLIDEIIIATTTSENDLVIVKEAEKLNVKTFRGSEDDVLSRYYFAAKENDLDIIVRITSDCPVIDWEIIDQVIDCYKCGDFEIVTNAGIDVKHRTFPRGLDLEVFSFETLKNTYEAAKEKYHREHVSPYIYETSNKVHTYKNNVDYSMYRWTLDTEDDWKLIQQLYNGLYREKHDFLLNDMVKYIEMNPEITKLNSHVEQKKIKGD